MSWKKNWIFLDSLIFFRFLEKKCQIIDITNLKQKFAISDHPYAN